MGEYLSMAEVLKLTVLSMLVVFACLLAISFILDFLKVIFNGRTEKKSESVVGKQSGVTSEGTLNPASRSVDTQTSTHSFEELALEENEFLVLAFTAAIAASSGKDVASLHIHSIKKIS